MSGHLIYSRPAKEEQALRVPLIVRVISLPPSLSLSLPPPLYPEASESLRSAGLWTPARGPRVTGALQTASLAAQLENTLLRLRVRGRTDRRAARPGGDPDNPTGAHRRARNTGGGGRGATAG